jgi:voltage-gated potassium channel
MLRNNEDKLLEDEDNPDPIKWRRRLRIIVFGTDTPAGKWFDVILVIAIILSVTVVMLASVPSIELKYHTQFVYIEWFVTILFTGEYIARIIVTHKSSNYIFSFYGLIDLFSTLPTYLSLFIPGSQSLLVIRLLRVLRIFRILKMGHYLREAKFITNALRASGYKISVFIFSVVILVTILGTLMYLIEGNVEGSLFTSIPTSIYWSIVTLTTVGFGDITPQTVAGQLLASIIMLVGYAIIAVPTGLVTAEMIKEDRKVRSVSKRCIECDAEILDSKSIFCSRCGIELKS